MGLLDDEAANPVIVVGVGKGRDFQLRFECYFENAHSKGRIRFDSLSIGVNGDASGGSASAFDPGNGFESQFSGNAFPGGRSKELFLEDSRVEQPAFLEIAVT